MPDDIYEIITYLIWAFDNLMNRIEVFYFNSNTCYDILIKRGAEHLLGDLLKSMRYKEILNDGTIDNLDYIRNIDRLKTK